MGCPHVIVDLPDSFEFDLDAENEGVDISYEDEIREWIADKLSDETEYCHLGFSYYKTSV